MDYMRSMPFRLHDRGVVFFLYFFKVPFTVGFIIFMTVNI